MAPKEETKGSYEVITGFCVGNAVNAWPAEILELTDAEAARWLAMGYIRKADPNKKAAPGPAVRNQDPRGVKTQDPR